MFLPSIVAIVDQTGPMQQAVPSRVVIFSDGSTAVEEIISCHPPSIVKYRVGQLTSMFRRLVKEGRVQILFSQNPSGGTMMKWRYTFYGHNQAATFILQPLVSIVWRGYLRSTLSQTRKLAEAEITPQSS